MEKNKGVFVVVALIIIAIAAFFIFYRLNVGQVNPSGGESITEVPSAPEIPLSTPQHAFVVVNQKSVYPAEVKINVGGSVNWINNRSDGRQGLAKIVGSKGFDLDSGEFLPGESFSYQFNEAGEYSWVESIRFYAGKVIVE